MKKIISFALCIVMALSLCGCSYIPEDVENQQSVTYTLTSAQSTPTDISYSLERYNLIRRAYLVNGQKEKADTLPCEVVKPLGYIVLFSGNTVVGTFIVDGKVTSLNSYLTPNYIEKYYAEGGVVSTELADVDGSYGENDAGIFFFTPDGKYMEWTGTYLYSDTPFVVENPVVTYEANVPKEGDTNE